MGIEQKEVESRLEKEFQPIYVHVEDQSQGCGSKFAVLMASAAFEGKSRLQRHRLVHDCLADIIDRIHALSLSLVTPAEYEAKIKSTE